MVQLEEAIKVLKSKATLIPIDEDITICSNFPNKLEPGVIDFIEINFNVRDRDMYGITFVNK